VVVAGRLVPLEDEDSWQTWVEDVADRFRWRHYHTRSSKGSDPGFPDLCLVRPPRLIYAELKTDSPRSRLSADQRAWADDLEAVGDATYAAAGVRVPEWYVWRPRDRPLILEVLA